MTETKTAPRPEAAARPAWRNKWRSIVDVGGCPLCRFYVPPGATYLECCLPPFETRAEAEAAASRDVLAQIARHGRLTDEWLGAVQEA